MATINSLRAAWLVPALCILSAASACAGQDKWTYLHRSRGADLRAVTMAVNREADGTVRYAIDDFPFGRAGCKVEFVVGPDGKPIEYVSASGEPGGLRWSLTFAVDRVVLRREMAGKPGEEHACEVRPGSLPDLNSRPDPYLTQHLLVRAYDFAKAGRQIFDVYDVDQTGKGVAAYQVSLERVDEEGVVLPNGRFKARHLVQLQQSDAPTWYKKHRGSQTDIWVNDQGDILRIYRHREPYEVILQDYRRNADRLSASESAQGIPQPSVKAP